jgi:excisionase family DNA binding protein
MAHTNRRERRHPEPPKTFGIGVPETATYLGVTQTTVYKLISEGRLPAYRVGDRIIRVKREDVEALLVRI